MTEIEKKFIACLIKQKVTSFKMSLCQHSESCNYTYTIFFISFLLCAFVPQLMYSRFCCIRITVHKMNIYIRIDFLINGCIIVLQVIHKRRSYYDYNFSKN